MIKRHILFIALLIPSLLLCKIYETNDLSDLLKEANKDDLVMLDLDCTLMMPDHGYLGSDPWFGYLMSKNKNEVPLTLPDYSIAVFNIWMKPAGPETKKVLRGLQEKNIATMGFTARSYPLATRTIMQLEKISLPLGFGNIPKEDFSLYTFEHGSPSVYKSGILFCGANDKNDILPQFLKKLSDKPKRIIFADDKMKNLKTVEQVAEKEGIEFIGFRYSACDDYVAGFSEQEKEKTNKEFEVLRHSYN